MADKFDTTYRIRTRVGEDAPDVINLNLNQHYDFFDILSLHINQKNNYNMPLSGYGVVCGRVQANGGFGIENAKVSIFIPYNMMEYEPKEFALYSYGDVNSSDRSTGVRYNLLPSFVDEGCHQDIGTMYGKDVLLDNDDIITIFEKYYKYTTKTNKAGDYMIGGVPVGDYVLHTDVDLSDIGALSQKPLDMVYKGYSPNQFENPSKFKYDTNLESLAQVKTQNKAIHVYPYWGDTTITTEAISITRCDIDIDYKFEPTCIFMGSIVTDSGTESINKKCIPSKGLGRMSNLTTGSGTIEMIRKTFSGKVEEFSIQGKQLIDENGTWCYQIPMNLDYVVTNEFGEMVPTDDLSKGIPTRSRVRFRVGITGTISGDSATKTAKFLVPNNPRIDSNYPNFSQSREPDYEFGTFTKDESFKDLYWNKVYTVKSYIPRLQKNTYPFAEKHSGIKKISFYGANNPMPYNNIAIRFNFMYRFVCAILKMLMYMVGAINLVLSSLAYFVLRPLIKGLEWLGIFRLLNEVFGSGVECWFKKTYASMHITMTSFCDTGGSNKEYAPMVIDGYINEYEKYMQECSEISQVSMESNMGELITCIQNSLAEENEVVSYNFQNDWLNGVLYAPQWYRKIRRKRRYFFNLIEVAGVDTWCSADRNSNTGFYGHLKLYQNGAIQRKVKNKFELQPISKINQEYNLGKFQAWLEQAGMHWGYQANKEEGGYGAQAHHRNLSYIDIDKGIITKKATKLAKLYGRDDYVYYYKPVEYDPNLNWKWGGERPVVDNETGDVKLLYATDLVLLGSLNGCDSDGIPQFFKELPSTTYNMPPNLIEMTYETDGLEVIDEVYTEMINGNTVRAEFDGANWGFRSWEQDKHPSTPPTTAAEADKNGDAKDPDGGLFYGLSCQFSYVIAKSIINMSRICEYGVSLDQSVDNTFFEGDGISEVSESIPPDGFVSYDEIEDMDGRSMFATLNLNGLRTKRDERTGYPVYDIKYCYPANFDGSLSVIMNNDKRNQTGYAKNHLLELNSEDYIRFRYGLDGIKFYRDGYEYEYLKRGHVGWDETVTNISNPNLKTKYNLDRFPIYENSFYFYFGLKPGQTAIDRFRRDFYSDCERDTQEEASIDGQYKPNSWCSETGDINPDGHILFNINGINTPYDIKVNNKNGDFCYKTITISDKAVRYYTLYDENIGSGYVRTEDGNLYITKMNAENIAFGNYSESDTLGLTDSDGYRIYLSNGTYEFTFTDSKGEETSTTIKFMGDSLGYENDTQNFTISNAELEEAPYNGYYSLIANASDNAPDGRRQIGGFITLSRIHRGNNAADDDIKCKISIIPEDSTWYTTTDTSAKNYYYPPVLVYDNGTFTLEDPDMHGLIYNTGGNAVIGLPKSSEKYILTVIEYCGEYATNNKVQEVLILGDAVEYRMYVNGVDYELIKNFDTAWRCSNTPYTYEVVAANGTLKGWTDIWNIGGVEEMVAEVKAYNANGYVGEQIEKLNNNLTDSAYAWTAEYMYSIDNFMDDIPEVTPDQLTGVYAYGKVKQADGVTPEYIIYERQEDGSYAELPDNPPLDYERYFNHLDDDKKIDIVNSINNIIANRKAVAQAMQDAFWMTDREGSKRLEVTYDCGNLPVKYLVRYTPDGGEDNSYYTLDGMYETNSIYGITEPTLDTDDNGDISYSKKPYYLAIANGIENTIPQALGYSGFMEQTPNQRNMFGVHYVAKYIDSRSLRSWNRHNNIPYFGGETFNDSSVSFDGSDPTVGRLINVDGMLCGYLMNGVTNSDTSDDDRVFEVQSVGDVHIKMHEFDAGTLKYPTKRMVYNNDGVYNGFILDNTLATEIPQQCAALSGGMDTLYLTQGGWNYACALSTEENMKVVPSQTLVMWRTNGLITTARYTITLNVNTSSAINIKYSTLYQTPIYDIYDGTASDYHIYSQSLSLNYDGETERNADNTITINGSSAGTNPLVVVGVKEDGVGVISSPAYDMAPIYWIANTQSDSLFIVFGGNQTSLKHWYLRNYDFKVIDGDNIETVSPQVTLDTKTYNNNTYYGINVSLSWNLSSSNIYIEDVLGVRYAPLKLS